MEKRFYSLVRPLSQARRTAIHAFILSWGCLLLGGLSSCSSKQGVAVGALHAPVAVAIGARLNEPFVIASKVPWNETGIHVVKGRCYRVQVETAGAEAYTDAGMPADAAGVNTFRGHLFDWLARDATGRSLLSRCVVCYARDFGAIHRLRVLVDAHGNKAHFVTLIAAVDHDDSQGNVVVIGKGGTFQAPRSGQLTLFSNDWPGGKGTDLCNDSRFVDSPTYANNTGHLRITVSPVSCPQHAH